MRDDKATFVSADEVARRAGVSRSAVSRTFTEGASVSAKTRQKVMEAAQALNYHVNHLARGLSKVASRPVCLIGSDLHAPFQAALLATLTERIQQAGRATMIINTAGGDADVEAALTRALEYRASSTVVMSGSPSEAVVQRCIATGQQVILINRKGPNPVQADPAQADHVLPGPLHVTIDYRRAMAQAVDMLRRAGCLRLAVVASTAGTPSLLARERGFLDSARQQGLEVQVVRTGPTAYQTGRDAAHALLAGPRPDGVFCVTDLIACGFIDAARGDFGLSIPRDLCVLGFDDIEQSGWDGYALSTFRQPLPAMADAVCHWLVHPGDIAATTLYFEAGPVHRKTIRPDEACPG